MLDTPYPEGVPLVRPATPFDEEELVEMVRLMHDDDEWGLADVNGVAFPFSEIKARATIQRATQRRNAPDAGQAWLGVIGEPGQLQGSAFVAVHEASMSDGFFLGELWNFCLPCARNVETSDLLIEFSMAVARMKNMRLRMAAMTQRRLGKSRFYARRFGPPIGSVYDYTPTGVTA